MTKCDGITDYDSGDKRCIKSGLLLDSDGVCYKCKQLQETRGE